MPNDIYSSLQLASDKAKEHAAATGQNPDDILVTLDGKKATSIDELNARGEVMPFVCSRVSDGPSAIPSGKAVCDGCGDDVWMSPATLGVFSKVAKRLILCGVCAEPHLKHIVPCGRIA